MSPDNGGVFKGVSRDRHLSTSEEQGVMEVRLGIESPITLPVEGFSKGVHGHADCMFTGILTMNNVMTAMRELCIS